MTRPFQLHVKSKLNYPIVKEDRIVYGPLNVLKLEAGRELEVKTGIKLDQCSSRGKVVVKPYKKYKDIVQFDDSEYDSNSKSEIVIVVKNLTKSFIRIEPEDYLFSFEYLPYDNTRGPKKSPVKQSVVAEPLVEPVVEAVIQEVGELSIAVPEPAPVEPVAAPVEPVAAPVEPVAAPVEPVAAPVEPVATKSVKKKVPTVKRKIHRSKKVSV